MPGVSPVTVVVVVLPPSASPRQAGQAGLGKTVYPLTGAAFCAAAANERPTCPLPATDVLPAVTTGTPGAPGAPLVGWEVSQPPVPPLSSFAQIAWTGKLPVASVISVAPPDVPGGIQMHLSAASLPLLSSQPPAGNWSVIVSAYSCPSTIVTPSRAPGELTKPSPQS